MLDGRKQMIAKGRDMSRESTWLERYKRTVYSQSGEDGIIEKILEIIPENDGWCVEFGAWDGLFINNTRNLIENKNYGAVLIEADTKKFRDLQRNYAQHKNIVTINAFVGFSENDNLDMLLGKTSIPQNFDLLSIDIDGNDYHVWKVVANYQPKLVVIEFNNTIPTPVRFVQPARASVSQGASLLSLVELGIEKGYELVSVLAGNAFFVKKEYYLPFEIASNAPEVLRTNLDDITYLFSGYDGRIFLRGKCELPWHSFKLDEHRIQHLPGLFRKFPANYSYLLKRLFFMFRAIREQGRFVKKIRHAIRRLCGCAV